VQSSSHSTQLVQLTGSLSRSSRPVGSPLLVYPSGRLVTFKLFQCAFDFFTARQIDFDSIISKVDFVGRWVSLLSFIQMFFKMLLPPPQNLVFIRQKFTVLGSTNGHLRTAVSRHSIACRIYASSECFYVAQSRLKHLRRVALTFF
jgi:hypothetical protein